MRVRFLGVGCLLLSACGGDSDGTVGVMRYDAGGAGEAGRFDAGVFAAGSFDASAPDAQPVVTLDAQAQLDAALSRDAGAPASDADFARGACIEGFTHVFGELDGVSVDETLSSPSIASLGSAYHFDFGSTNFGSQLAMLAFDAPPSASVFTSLREARFTFALTNGPNQSGCADATSTGLLDPGHMVVFLDRIARLDCSDGTPVDGAITIRDNKITGTIDGMQVDVPEAGNYVMLNDNWGASYDYAYPHERISLQVMFKEPRVYGGPPIGGTLQMFDPSSGALLGTYCVVSGPTLPWAVETGVDRSVIKIDKFRKLGTCEQRPSHGHLTLCISGDFAPPTP